VVIRVPRIFVPRLVVLLLVPVVFVLRLVLVLCVPVVFVLRLVLVLCVPVVFVLRLLVVIVIVVCMPVMLMLDLSAIINIHVPVVVFVLWLVIVFITVAPRLIQQPFQLVELPAGVGKLMLAQRRLDLGEKLLQAMTGRAILSDGLLVGADQGRQALHDLGFVGGSFGLPLGQLRLLLHGCCFGLG